MRRVHHYRMDSCLADVPQFLVPLTLINGADWAIEQLPVSPSYQLAMAVPFQGKRGKWEEKDNLCLEDKGPKHPSQHPAPLYYVWLMFSDSWVCPSLDLQLCGFDVA